jgi:hydrogenase maturation protein HypF
LQHLKRFQLHYTGIVQGVGFRPAVYRLALKLGIAGFVSNRSDGVMVEIETAPEIADRFISELKQTLPAPAVIEKFTCREIEPLGASGFTIRDSSAAAARNFSIGPDTATCPACLKEMRDPGDRRFSYPFINCTVCGPRLTIVNDLPYDRSRTAMAAFPLCRHCRDEYENPASRRFHAEAIACPECGPQLTLTDHKGQTLAKKTAALKQCVNLLETGHIVAVKGLGGFHLAVAAADETAVNRLRQRKHRAAKPFALMVKNLAAAEELAHISPDEKELLCAPARPIVLLRKRADSRKLPAAAVAPNLAHLGIMLPYTPLHHLLFAAGISPLVMTSANLNDEPICIDNHEALQRIENIADFFLLNDRDIVVRLDDSIVMAAAGKSQVLRRSRGLVPETVDLLNNSPEILALGGQLKNTLCLIRQRKAFISPHIGDLETPGARNFFHNSRKFLEKIADTVPKIIACDLHPGYYTTLAAAKLPARKLVKVQHHHAHIVSGMADNRISGPVLGLALDGTGYGLDGHIWGGEFLRADETDFTRLGHLSYFPLPGGELAIREPWRIALALLHTAFPDNWQEIAARLQLVPAGFSASQLEMLLLQRLNRPLTSSLGRFFDGMAAALGIGHKVAYEGQAAIELEALTDGIEKFGGYAHPLSATIEDAGDNETTCIKLNLLPIFKEIVLLSLNGCDRKKLAALWHDSLVEALMTLAAKLSREHQLNRIVFSGGCWQNRRLLEGCCEWPRANRRLETAMQIFIHRRVPTNDGGLALGQAVCAAAKLAGQDLTNRRE